MGPTAFRHRWLVLEQQLVERLSSFYEHHRDPSLFGLDARLKDEAHRPAVAKALLAAVEEVAGGQVDENRLKDIKSHLRYSLLMDLETPSQVAEALAWHVGVFGVPDAIDKLYENIEKVRPRDLTAFAKKYLVDQNRTTLDFTIELKEGTP